MSQFILKNNRAKIVFSDKARVVLLENLSSEKSLPVLDRPFAYLTTSNGDKLEPDSLDIQNNTITLVFGNIKVELSVKTHPDYFEFTVISELPVLASSFEFCCITLDKFKFTPDAPAFFSYALTDNVNDAMYPDGSKGESFGQVMRKFGSVGGRLALVLCRQNELREILKTIHSNLRPADRAVLSIGGPYAREYEKNHGNYVIISQTDESNLETYKEFYTKMGVSQLDFHQGPNSFRQGDFYFHKYGGSASEFKKRFADPLSKAGILSGLHTYAFYVDPFCDPILSDEKWQKQLCVLDEFTLDEDVDETGLFFKTKENSSTFSTNHTFFSDSLPYALIDTELVQIKPVKNGFEVVKRAHAGTVAAPHKKGAVIKHMFARFCMFTPVIGSELFYKIARDTAKAYNEGGFEMIYLDALDGIGHHCPKNEAWYWAEQFVNTIVKNCDTPPIIEYSTMYPSLWAPRGRMGAWDAPFRGFREFLKVHIRDNSVWEKRQYTTTLGWYMMYPIMNDKLPANYAMRYQFEDDVDYVGTKAFEHGSSMVFLSLNADNCEKFPAFEKNVQNYRRYSEAMNDKALVALREKLIASPFEKRLVEKDGEKYFVEKHYKKSKIYNAEKNQDKVLFENPFGEQKPFVRLEGHLSTSEYKGTVLVHFDESAPVHSGVYDFDYTDMTSRLALKVRVKGNGKKSALVFRLGSSWNAGKGVADYTVFLNFEGWREIVLAEVDNGNFPEAMPAVPNDFGAYSYYRSTVNYDHANRLEVFSVGDVEGVSIGDVEACVHEETVAKSITLSAGSKRIEFKPNLTSFEYLEYYPEDNRAVKFDRFGKCEEVLFEGEMPCVKSGAGELSITASGDTKPLRFTATVGVSGNIIK